MAKLDPYLWFEREAWARLRASTPLTLTAEDLERLKGINEKIDIQEVEQVYLPLTRLLNIQFTASRALRKATATFVGSQAEHAPYVIGLAGSVAVGKSTTARILQALLSCWSDHPRVELVTTDGFLFPNNILKARELMHRKGFPESYDTLRLLEFLAQLKAGKQRLEAPLYSHLQYDVLATEMLQIDQPDILILEGLNVLQTPRIKAGQKARQVVSDFFDFSIYVHAEEAVIQRWFFERFETLKKTAFLDPSSFFHHFAQMPEDEVKRYADNAWHNINAVNLRENILPTMERATLILEKGPGHAARRVALRR